jgi:hypothetical protein
MFIENLRDLSHCLRICDKTLCPTIRRSSNLERMPNPSRGLMVGEAPWHQVCAVESDMLRFSYRERFLLCYVGMIRLRNDSMKIGEQFLVQLENLRDVLLDRCSRLGW